MSLFPPALPDGFQLQPDFISADEEHRLVRVIDEMEFSPVEMRGVVARRRTIHFGWTYGYYARRTETGPPLPAFLLPLRERLAVWAGIAPESFAEALITEYPPGAPIGWHRDAPIFGDVIGGVSLLAAARMSFRPYVAPTLTRRGEIRHRSHLVDLTPRSAYLITAAARRDYEHSIPPVAARRYSITFRTLRDP